MATVGIEEVDGKLSVLSAVVSILAALGYVVFKLWSAVGEVVKL